MGVDNAGGKRFTNQANLPKAIDGLRGDEFKIGKWSPSSWTYPEWGGLYTEGDRKLYVNTGIGENLEDKS